MVALHLVRHAEPVQDLTHPPWEWGLSPAAGARLKELRRADVLPAEALWVSSPEPKAAATAALLTAAEVRLDDDLREARRARDYVDHATFVRRVLRSFADLENPAADGWEPLSATRARIVRAAESAVAKADGRDIVLVGHGTAMTVLVAALTATPPDVAAWQRMLMPDHCSLTWPGEVTSPWGQWAT